MADISCDIKEEIVSVPSDSQGWNLELNLVSWNEREAKYDLRKWNDDHSKSGKGITMSEDEVVMLFQKYKEVIKKITGEDVDSFSSGGVEDLQDLPFGE